MATEIIRYRINAENAQAFETAYQKAEPILQGSRHCLGYRLLRGYEEPENWILIIEWDSLEGHEQGFRKEPSFREFFALVKPFFNDIQEMKHYAATRTKWQRIA
jgi:heme-degrading monooxygenase HmoA